jgi:2'-5' RNA ligase
MFSINVPVPTEVARVRETLYHELAGFERIRNRHTLVLKRIDTSDSGGQRLHRVRERVRECLRSSKMPVQRSIHLKIDTIDFFDDPPAGSAPVVYFHVDSDPLRYLHLYLCGQFNPVEEIEATDYVPHVTLARGGSVDNARRVCSNVSFEPISWQVNELHIWDNRYREVGASVSI